ncbi:MAG: hypothetical protein SGPRY_009399, partial [Prymnesium sp.]
MVVVLVLVMTSGRVEERRGHPPLVPSDCKEALFPPAQVLAGTALVKVLRAHGLLAKDWNGKSDPYVSIYTTDGQMAKTSVIRRNLNPVWNETLRLNISDPSQPLLVR